MSFIFFIFFSVYLQNFYVLDWLSRVPSKLDLAIPGPSALLAFLVNVKQSNFYADMK